jgi:maleate isomerase
MLRILPDVNYGTRYKLGIMLPAGNTVAEPQLTAMLPRGVSLHVTRLRLQNSDHLAMLERLEEAVALLADARVDRIAFHCTAVSMWSPEISAQISARIAAATDIPSIVTSDAIVAALRTLGATRIVLVSPYVQATNDREIALLAHNGITVLRDKALGIERTMGTVEPARWREEVLAMRDPAAQAYFVSCTAIKSADVIDELERELDRPVITSNQAMLWHALRSAGITEPVAGFGRLLQAH